MASSTMKLTSTAIEERSNMAKRTREASGCFDETIGSPKLNKAARKLQTKLGLLATYTYVGNYNYTIYIYICNLPIG